VPFHVRGNFSSHDASIKNVGPFSGQPAKRSSENGLPKALSFGESRAVRPQEKSGGRGTVLQILLMAEKNAVSERTEREALLGVVDGWPEQIGPGERFTAVSPPRVVEYL
jgi:hypothetical protein